MSLLLSRACSDYRLRRSELLGLRRDLLDLDAGTLEIDDASISVAGWAEEPDGRSERSAGLDRPATDLIGRMIEEAVKRSQDDTRSTG